jgi:hypothetical protein
MGGSESKSSVTTNVKQVIDNQTDIKMIKETVNKNIMNTMTEQASSCTAAAIAKQTQKTKVGNIKGLKRGKIGGGDQEQKVKVKLSCVDVSKIENNMANDVANAFASQLETKFDTSAMAKLEGNAKTQAEGGFLPLGSTKTDSNVSTNYDLNVSNKISKTMHDMITNETQRNFHTKTLKERLATLQAEQAMETEVGNIEDSEDLEIGGGKQKQDAELIMEAIAEDQTINKTIDKIANQLNSIDVTGVTTKAATEVTASATSEAKQKGFDSIVDSITGMIGGIFKGWFGMMMIGLIVVCVIGVVFFMTGGQETLQQGMTLAADKMGGGSNPTGIKMNKSDKNLVYAFKSLRMNELLI